jgi:Tfp pilus assembly protein PilZ
MIIDGATVDISNGGVFLHFESQMVLQVERNAIIQMEIDLPNSKGVHLEGQVRWVNQADAKYSQRHPTGIGVAFVDVNQSAQKALKRTVHNLLRGKGTVLYPQAQEAAKV